MSPNETAVRNAYQVAEDKDIAAWVNCFTEDGAFTDESIGVTYRGYRERRTDRWNCPWEPYHRRANG